MSRCFPFPPPGCTRPRLPRIFNPIQLQQERERTGKRRRNDGEGRSMGSIHSFLLGNGTEESGGQSSGVSVELGLVSVRRQQHYYASEPSSYQSRKKIKLDVTNGTEKICRLVVFLCFAVCFCYLSNLWV